MSRHVARPNAHIIELFNCALSCDTQKKIALVHRSLCGVISELHCAHLSADAIRMHSDISSPLGEDIQMRKIVGHV